MAGKKGMKDYPPEIRLAAIRLYLGGGITQAEIAKELGVRSARQIETWVRKYRRAGGSLSWLSEGRSRKVQNDVARIRQLEMENALLKKFHTELRKLQLAQRNIGQSTTTAKNSK
jgi:transposase-like protein